MNDAGFVRIDRDGPQEPRHLVVHAGTPGFRVELQPSPGGGVLRRLCVPNSWAGDYGRYARLMAAAQDFFERTSGPPALRRG